MSSSFIIPLEAVFTEDAELSVRYRTEQVFSPVFGYDAFGKRHIASIATNTVHSINAAGRWFEVYPMTVVDQLTGLTEVTGFSFSGFEQTCKDLQEGLGISVELD